MKKTLILTFLLTSLLAVAKTNDRYNIVAGTNSISISGTRFPLNSIVLKVFPDSIFVQFFTSTIYGQIECPITQRDSFKHYLNNGVAFTSVSQVDSFYQAKFVK